MFKVGDLLVYQRNVCKVVDVKAKAFNDMDYYVLNPIYDSTLKLQIPTTNPDIRSLITKKKVNEIIKKIPEIEQIENINARFKSVESKYRDLLNSGSYEDLISIIKTAYQKKQDRLDSKKPVGNTDNNFSKLAEQYLFNEFAVVLGMSYHATKNYIMNCIIK